MKIFKFILCLIILAFFIAGILSSCSADNYACSTYKGHYSNLHARK